MSHGLICFFLKTMFLQDESLHNAQPIVPNILYTGKSSWQKNARAFRAQASVQEFFRANFLTPRISFAHELFRRFSQDGLGNWCSIACWVAQRRLRSAALSAEQQMP